MRNTYLVLTIIGTALPNVFVFKEMMESGNILLYRFPFETFSQMFANNVSSAFAVDLLFIVAMFLFWSYKQSLKYKIKSWPLVWIYTFAFGIAGGLPLFLFLLEKHKA